MARALRLEFPGSLWHITSRGNQKQDIYYDDTDRTIFLELLGKAVARFHWILLAYVLMSNHFHLVLRLTVESLSRGMQWLNGEYPRKFNKRHRRSGHLYQGRFDGRLVDEEAYGLEVLRYVVLNPVRAGMTRTPEDYKWSSHRAVIGKVEPPPWLATDDVLISFGVERDVARPRYCGFVHEAIGSTESPWSHLVGQIYLGREEWVESMRDKVKLKPRSDEYPRAQRLIAMPMADVVAAVCSTWSISVDRVRRDGVPRLIAAWIGSRQAMLTNREIAAGLRLNSAGYVSRLISDFDRALDEDPQLQRAVEECAATLRRKQEQSKL